MDIEIVKKYICIYKVPKITVKNSISQWLTYLYKGLLIEEYHWFTLQKGKITVHYNIFTENENI